VSIASPAFPQTAGGLGPGKGSQAARRLDAFYLTLQDSFPIDGLQVNWKTYISPHLVNTCPARFSRLEIKCDFSQTCEHENYREGGGEIVSIDPNRSHLSDKTPAVSSPINTGTGLMSLLTAIPAAKLWCQQIASISQITFVVSEVPRRHQGPHSLCFTEDLLANPSIFPP
jgi:hypothetical protein